MSKKVPDLVKLDKVYKKTRSATNPFEDEFIQKVYSSKGKGQYSIKLPKRFLEYLGGYKEGCRLKFIFKDIDKEKPAVTVEFLK